MRYKNRLIIYNLNANYQYFLDLSKTNVKQFKAYQEQNYTQVPNDS